MNIQKINMLSLDNQIKLKEEGTAPVSTPIAQEGAESKNVMKAMDLFGKTNYMNNVAFQGGMKHKAAAYAMGTLLALGAMSLTSCKDSNVEELHPNGPVEVNVSNTVSVNMASLVETMQQLLEQQRQRDEIDAQRWIKINNFMNDLLVLIEKGQINDAEFYKQMFAYMVENNDNQKLILSQLQANGMSQEEANKLIQKLINEVQDGKLSAQEAWAQIQELLGSIDNSLKSILEDLHGARQQLQGLLLLGHINNKQNVEVQKYLQTIIEGQDNIAGKIDKNTKTIEEVAAQLGMSLNDIKSLLSDLGYAMVAINQMTAEEIVNAINSNTAVLKAIQKQNADMADMVDKGIMSQDVANKTMIDLLENIDVNVADIKNTISNYYGDKTGILSKLDRIIEQGDEQIGQNGEHTLLLTQILGMLKNGVSKDQVELLINYAAKGSVDMDKLLKLVSALNQNVTDGRTENKKFAGDVIETLNRLGMENADNFTTVINKMNSLDNGAADLRALIQSFMNAYKDGHKITTGQLKDLIDAVNNISISGGSADLTSIENMLKELVGLTKDNKGLLTSIDAKIDLINVVENAILDEVKAIHQGVQNIPNYEKELADIKKLLEELKNKPDYDDSKILKELMEINETVKTRDFCDCECGGGHNEQIID